MTSSTVSRWPISKNIRRRCSKISSISSALVSRIVIRASTAGGSEGAVRLVAIAFGCYFTSGGRSICAGHGLNVGSTGADQSQTRLLGQGGQQFAGYAVVHFRGTFQLFRVTNYQLQPPPRQA